MSERGILPGQPDPLRAPNEGAEALGVSVQGGMNEESGRQRPPDPPSGWLIVRRDGTIVTAERRACELLGAPDQDALVGREWLSLFPSETPPNEARMAIATGGSWSGVLPYRYAKEPVALSTIIAPVSRSSDLSVVSLEAPKARPRLPGVHQHVETARVRPTPPRESSREKPLEKLPAEPPEKPREPRAKTLGDAAPSTPDVATGPQVMAAHLAVHEALRDLEEPGAAGRAVLQSLQPAVSFDWGAVLRFVDGDVVVLATYPSPMAGVAPGVRWTPPARVEALIRSTGEPVMEGDIGPEASASPLGRMPAFGLRSRVLIPLYAGARVAGALVLYRAGARGFEAVDGMLAERTVSRLGEALREVEAAAVSAPEPEPRHATVVPAPAAEPEARASSEEPQAPAVEERAADEPARTVPVPDVAVPMSRLEAMGELVAGVAHELNNPLTAILGYAQIVGSLDDGEREHALKTIEDEAQRAARIVRNLLAFARQRPGDRHSVDLEAVLRRIIDLRRYSLEMDDVRVITRFGHIPAVQVDEGQFEQAFLNLLSNAHQALEERGGEIQVSTWTSDTDAYISFADDGPGVPPSMRSRVFEPFFTTRDVGDGAGMGLAIVYGVVTNHGGRTWVEPSPAGGANFVIELPLRPTNEAPGETRALPGREWGIIRGGSDRSSNGSAPASAVRHAEGRESRERVLVVDDEAPVRALTREILTGQGYEVWTAENGQVALRMLEREPVDLVITDLRMPGLSGADLYRVLEERWPALRDRVLFVTGDIEGDRGGRTLDREQIRYLEKPFTTRQLLDAVEALLAEAKSSEE